MNKLWSDVDIKFLKTNYGKISTKDITIKLNRSLTSIHRKVQNLEIVTRKNAPANFWTKKDVSILRKWHTKKTCVELVKMVNHTWDEVYAKLINIGLKPKLIKPTKYWTKEEDEFIIKHRDAPLKYLIKILNRSIYSISYRKQILGVTFNNTYSRQWTNEEINTLKNNSHLKLQDLVKLLPSRTKRVISEKALTLKEKYHQYNKIIIKNYYKFVMVNGKRTRKHKYLAIKYFGEELTKGNDIHHLNFDKHCNFKQNLLIIPRDKHHQLHANMIKLINPLVTAGFVIHDYYEDAFKNSKPTLTSKERKEIYKSFNKNTNISPTYEHNIIKILQTMNSNPSNSYKKWTAEEIKILIDNKNITYYELCCLLPTHNIKAIEYKMNKLNIPVVKNPEKLRRLVNKQGYSILKINGKYLLEHRIIMSLYLGRLLTKQEIIHHCDGNPNNNSISNLLCCQNQSIHKQIEFSINKCMPELYKDGIVRYSHKTQSYELGRNFYK